MMTVNTKQDIMETIEVNEGQRCYKFAHRCIFCKRSFNTYNDNVLDLCSDCAKIRRIPTSRIREEIIEKEIVSNKKNLFEEMMDEEIENGRCN